MREYKSLHHEMHEKGYRLATVIDSRDGAIFAKRLADVAIDSAEKRYENVRIVPGDIAMRGEEWVAEEGYHFVYTTSPLEGGKFSLVAVKCRHFTSGEISPQLVSSFYRQKIPEEVK